MKMNLSVSLMCLTVPLALVSSGARAAYVAEPDAAHSAQTRRHTGIPSVAVARNGRLWATFYGSPTGGEDSNNYCTLATSADGTIPTYFDSRKGSDWVNCMVYVADRLEALDARTERRSRRVVIGARQSFGHRPAFRRAMLSRSRTSLQTARRYSTVRKCPCNLRDDFYHGRNAPAICEAISTTVENANFCDLRLNPLKNTHLLNKEEMKINKLLIATGAAAFAVGAAHAITYTVGAGDTQTATGVTYSERVEKLGDGTLVFTGNNSLSTLTSSAGTVNVHGDTTTISGSGSDGEGANAAFVNQGSEFIVDGGGTINLTGGAYGHTDNGVLLVTNGRLAGRSSIPATARACMCTIRRAPRSS